MTKRSDMTNTFSRWCFFHFPIPPVSIFAHHFCRYDTKLKGLYDDKIVNHIITGQ